MKKDYLKPTARSHELRCRSMVAQSPLQEAKLPIMRSDSYGGTDDDSDEMIMWAD